MGTGSFVGIAIVATMLPAIAHADDPRDAAMRDAAARAHDSEMTRQLNLKAGVAARATGQRRTVLAGGGDYAAAMRAHDDEMARYARNRARYEHDMAEWRRAVAACRTGDYSACDY
ncbi:hypothetical protein F9288_03750 [Sphingomonas sp. CL5.1]|uniref:hypothetical protein n=1 Tax=Sphingomonas sp. CL5.1 TaxID=2653203 RepID=UPI0015835DCF|nr:hypothetical protein [Sphingomonas sp. CL5.1]QKR98861.1 hypothetical protein F9288_03750 [Sphingomonas sp. CL5.1]